MHGVQARDEPAQAAASFSIEPLQQELPAKTACNFLIRGNFANARALEERLRCIDSELHEIFSFHVRSAFTRQCSIANERHMHAERSNLALQELASSSGAAAA